VGAGFQRIGEHKLTYSAITAFAEFKSWAATAS